MSWNSIYGCCNCTPKEMSIAGRLAVVIFILWWVCMHTIAYKMNTNEDNNDKG